jgi:hypothetical protein
MSAGKKEDFIQAMVNLCNNGISFAGEFYPSALY